MISSEDMVTKTGVHQSLFSDVVGIQSWLLTTVTLAQSAGVGTHSVQVETCVLGKWTI